MKIILNEATHLEGLFDSMPLYLQRRLKIRDLLYFDLNLDKYIREMPPGNSFEDFSDYVIYEMLHHFVVDERGHEIDTRIDPEYGIMYDDDSLDKVFGMYWELGPLLIDRYEKKLEMGYNKKLSQSPIKKDLKEEYQPTETDLLYWEIPKKIVDELGFKLYDENDVVYIQEIHFDTQNVLFSFYNKEPWGEEVPYDNSLVVPGSFDAYKTIPINKLSDKMLNFILRRIEPKYVKYLK